MGKPPLDPHEGNGLIRAHLHELGALLWGYSKSGVENQGLSPRHPACVS